MIMTPVIRPVPLEYIDAPSIRDMIDAWIARNCPVGGVPQGPEYCARVARLLKPVKFALGGLTPSCPLIRYIPDYHKWRTEEARRRSPGRADVSGDRVVDLEMQALRVCYRWAVEVGICEIEPLRRLRNFRRPEDVVHSREKMPASADEIHRVAASLFRSNTKSQVNAWLMLFLAYTGMRISEAVALRKDNPKGFPGGTDGNMLFIRRAKRGRFNYIRITGEFYDLFRAHDEWHRKRSGGNPFYFPVQKRGKIAPMSGGSLGDAIDRECERAGITRFSPHGLRAFFVTAMRSRGMSNEAVAALIGDKTSSLIETTYGELPEVWNGGEPLTLHPVSVSAAWVAAAPPLGIAYVELPWRPRTECEQAPAPVRC